MPDSIQMDFTSATANCCNTVFPPKENEDESSSSQIENKLL